MKTRRLAFAFFAAAIPFSMVREWMAPVVCARTILVPRGSQRLSLPTNKWSAMEVTAHHRGATGASLNTGGGPP